MHLGGIYLFDVYIPWWAGGVVVLGAAAAMRLARRVIAGSRRARGR